MAGYGVLKGLERVSSVSPGARIGLATGATGVFTVLSIIDKILSNSVGANRALVTIQEIATGKKITSLDSKYGSCASATFRWSTF